MIDWKAIRAYYATRHSVLAAAPANRWALDPYEWKEGGIRMTPIEAALWHDIRAEGLVLYPQYPVGRYFVDFGNPAAKVAIECDGAAWHLNTDADKLRQASIESYGWSVYRLTGRQCFEDTTEVEDDDSGCVLLVPCHARQLLRAIAARHAISTRM